MMIVNITNYSAVEYSFLFNQTVNKCVTLYQYRCSVEHIKILLLLSIFLNFFLILEIYRAKKKKTE